MTPRMARTDLVCTLLLCALGCSVTPQTQQPPGGGKADGADSDPDSDRNRTCPGGCDVGTVCDTVVEACIAEPGAPTLQSPISGARTSGVPVVAWTSAPAASDSLVKICRDLECSEVTARLTGTAGAPLPFPLVRGAYFVRGYGRSQQPDGHEVIGADHTTTRVIFANGGSAPTIQPLGLEPDFDRDGRVDVLRVESATDGSSTQLLELELASGKTPTVAGADYAFGTYATPVLDLDGDGRDELVTVAQLGVNPINLMRYQLDLDSNLQLVQTVSFTIPPGETLVGLLSLGDVDGDGFADLGVQLSLPPRITTGDGGGTLAYFTGIELDILHGSPSGLGAPEVVQFAVPQDEQTFSPAAGNVLVPVGDVDGDGFPDLALEVQTLDPVDRVVSGQLHHADVFAGARTNPYQRTIARLAYTDQVVGLGDIDGDGLADVGSVRASGYTFTYLDGGGYLEGIQPAQIVIAYGSSTLRVAAPWTLPVDQVPGCSNGTGPGYDNFPRQGWLIGGGDLDGDGFDDVLLEIDGVHDGSGTGVHHCDGSPSVAEVHVGTSAGLDTGVTQVLTNPAGMTFGMPILVEFVGALVPGPGGDDLVVGTPSGYSTVPERLDVLGGTRGEISVIRPL